MLTYKITKKQARHFLLSHQKLVASASTDGKTSIYNYIRHVGCIQYDPLNIAGHNHELILQARIPGFTPELIQDLLYKDRLLLDGWDKNMSIYCTEDWPFFKRRRDASAAYHQANESVMRTVPQVREELMKRGPLSSLELDWSNKVEWAWAPTRLSRAALESMYFWGELVVHHRIHTRRYYDFTSHLLPTDLLTKEDPNSTEEQYHDWYVQRRIGSIGLLWNKSGDGWLGISNLKSKERTAAIQRLLHKDELREVLVDGIKLPLYMRSIDAPTMEAVLEQDAEMSHNHTRDSFAAVLAPLDNLLWDRELIRQLFGFHYRWEVYKPVHEREYGYYVLPLLYNDRLIGRLEPVMDKKNGILNIKNWWWEPGESLTPEMTPALVEALSSHMRSVRASKIQIVPEVITSCGLEGLLEHSLFL